MDRMIDDMIRGTEYEKKMLRTKRKPLLDAFDKYKTNVEYGIEDETAEQHEAVIQWYRQLLDINTSRASIENVPSCISYYVVKGGRK